MPSVARLPRTYVVLAALIASGACTDDHVVGPTPDASLAAARGPTMSVTPSATTLMLGESVQLATSIVTGNRDETSGKIAKATGGGSAKGVRWVSTDPAVAAVSPDGFVTTVGEGEASIFAYRGNTFARADLLVIPKGFIVAPDGKSSGDGSRERPWDLATALDGADGDVVPGSLVWIRGGTYPGAFRGEVSGTALAPIVFRAYPRERAIIDGASSSNSTLKILGDWTVYQGFEIMSSDPDRTGSRPDLVYFDDATANSKIVNLVLHDGGNAIYTDKRARDIEVYGCIIYNNGWQSSRGSGHAIYTKNLAGWKRFRDNVMFNQFGYGVHAFSDPGSGVIFNIELDGNVSFNNGSLARPGRPGSANILVGGYDKSDNVHLRENMTYFSPGYDVMNVRVGYTNTLLNGAATVRDNYIVGGTLAMDVGFWNAVTMTGNTLLSLAEVVDLRDNTVSGQTWDGNVYLNDPAAWVWRYDSRSFTFEGWRAATGLTGVDQATATLPTAPRVFVRPNAYEAGRATIVVYNWTNHSAVAADVAGVLQPGDSYELRSVQNPIGEPLASGVYRGGMLSMPMGSSTPAAPIGGSASPVPSTGVAFDAFLLTRTMSARMSMPFEDRGGRDDDEDTGGV
jgi:hypothetical protein